MIRVAVGIEAIGVYAGRASVGVREIFDRRSLDPSRFDNLMMERKSVGLPCEDAVTNAVNAAKPLVDALTEAERGAVEAVIVGTESGLDFGKPISTYVQEYLGLPRTCRSFEVKHACYGGTAALQTAVALIAATPVDGVKALVIAADAASATDRDSYWEPSQGAGAVAMLVGKDPHILELDPGASGLYSHEVMDTLRPRADLEAGDSDLSLLSYLHCLEQAYRMYERRVDGCDLRSTFAHLVFHTPFAGMVKGAHRTLMRKVTGASPADIEADFTHRLAPSLRYGRQVGNVYSASLYLALCSLIDNGALAPPQRAGLFSYGSGCASEFFSGVLPPGARARLAAQRLPEAIAARHSLDWDDYEQVSDLAVHRMAGVRDHVFDPEPYDALYRKCLDGRGLLVLDRIKDFHRAYRWS
ncbi:MAG: 3-hydroxy-3-methylglutaryl-ACP synthase [Streptosporangiales bacterium]|nr:3-hydroxy-3-methylglutaryl-ACP synthase [Streptosporangiales bacterium]